MIYFVRDGESEANQRGVFAGQKDDSVLTEKGRNQALITAQEIKNENLKISKIISSPLRRTMEMAEIIAKEIGLDSSKIAIDNRIAEYDMGSLTGTPLKDISSISLTSAKGAEDPSSFHNRVYSCVKELSQIPENILLISHAGVGRMLEVIKEDKQAKLFYDIPAYPNASVTKIDWIK